MKLEIVIDKLKPIGLNNSYFLSSRGGYARRVKKPETKQFEKYFDLELEKYARDIQTFNNNYNGLTHYVSCRYDFYIPLFTRANTINKRSGDIDGLIKISQDCLFKHLDCDDSQILELNVKKINFENYKIAMNVEVKPLTLIK